MRAKRAVLAPVLALGLLLAPGPGEADLLPGEGSAAVPMPGAAHARAACTIEVCVTVDLWVVEAKVCYEKEYPC